ncbi:tail fiber domain-containing protein [Enterococcus cecorum]|nr:tail fiber domain-containing protein [Enterococcus cecorum]CAI3501296.1 tail fiber domain-containing protein [Enterococcus cecorum]
MEHIRIAIRDSTDSMNICFLDNKAGIKFHEATLQRFLKGTCNFLTLKFYGKDIDTIYPGCRLAFKYDGNDYWLTINSFEKNGYECSLTAYSLSLETNKEKRKAFKAPKWTFKQYLDYVDPEHSLTLGLNEVASQSMQLEWSGTDTILARLFSIANSFGAELEFVTELNDDYSLKRHVLNVYKVGNIGKDKTGMPIRVGKSLKVINYTANIDELYTAIRVHGKDGLTIAGLDKKVYDKDNNLLYYTQGDTLYAPQSRDRFPAIAHKASDSFICLESEDTEHSSKESLYAYMLGELKKHSEPKIDYETEGYVDGQIGDRMLLIDSVHYDPPLYVEARISEQTISLLDKPKNKTVFTNYERKESEIANELLAKMNALIEENKVYDVQILTSNGYSFKNGQGSTTLTARVMDGPKDVTNEFSLTWFKNSTEYAHTASINVQAGSIDELATYLIIAEKDGRERGRNELTVFNVKDGSPGKTPVVHLAWADSSDGSVGFSLELPTDKIPKYRGYYVDYSTVASTNPKLYKWERNPDDAAKVADEAKDKADSANSKADSAISTANTAKDTADEASKQTALVNELANTAKELADKANADAAEANRLIGLANGEIDRLNTDVSTAKSDLASAESELNSKIETVKTTVTNDYAKKTELSDTKITLNKTISDSVASVKQEMSETYAVKSDLTTLQGEYNSFKEDTAQKISQQVSSIQTIQTDTTEAQKLANDAYNKANSAVTSATNASSTANSALDKAADATSVANSASQNATNAVASANSAVSTANTAKSNADKAIADVAALTKTVSSQSTRIDQTSSRIDQVASGVTEVGNKVDSLKLVGENLILNGYGEFGNNKNFNNYIFDGTNSYNNKPSFKTNLKTALSIGNSRISIDIDKAYQFSMNIKSDNGGTIYLGWDEYDIDGYYISPTYAMGFPNTTTSLARDLNDGDTVVYLESTANWVDSNATHQNGLIFWNYRDSTGYLYPEGVYSRNAWIDLYTKENVNKTNNTITLKSSWTHGTIKAGTRVSQSNSSGHKYRNFTNTSVPTSWKNTSFIIGKDHQLQSPYSFDETRFSPAAKSISFMAIWSYGTSVVDTYYINSIELKNIDDKLLIDGINTNLSNNYYAKSTVDSKLSTAVSGITAQYTKDISTQLNNYYDKATMDRRLTIGDVGIETYVQDTRSKLDGLQIGGRNLLKDTANFGNSGRPSGSKDGWLAVYSSTIESEKYNGLTVRSLKNVASMKNMCEYYFTGFNLGDTYTLSFWAKGTIDRFRCYFYGDSGFVGAKPVNTSIPCYSSSAFADGYCSFVNPQITNWTRISITWKLADTGDINIAKRVLIRTDEATGGDLYVCGVKLEKGNQATDWSPAPEDMATLTQYTEVKQLADQLSATVYDSASGLVTKTTQLANSYAIKQLNSAGDILTSLNLNANTSTAEIDAKLIRLNGYTKMDDAFINNLVANSIVTNKIKATEISGDYIKGGTIDGTIIKSTGPNGTTKLTDGWFISTQNNAIGHYGAQSVDMTIYDSSGYAGSTKLTYNGFLNEMKNSGGVFAKRKITFHAEGFQIEPEDTNVGTNLNSGINLVGRKAYLDFVANTIHRTDATPYHLRIIASEDGKSIIESTQGGLEIYIKNQEQLVVNANYIPQTNMDNNTGIKRMVVAKPNESGSYMEIRNRAGKAWGISMWLSDQRLKNNIKPSILDSLATINQLQVKQFDWKSDNVHEDFGLIAQEVEQILPNAVFKVGDYYQIKDSGLIPVLIGAVQKLSNKVNLLENIIYNIKGGNLI